MSNTNRLSVLEELESIEMMPGVTYEFIARHHSTCRLQIALNHCQIFIRELCLKKLKGMMNKKSAKATSLPYREQYAALCC